MHFYYYIFFRSSTLCSIGPHISNISAPWNHVSNPVSTHWLEVLTVSQTLFLCFLIIYYRAHFLRTRLIFVLQMSTWLHWKNNLISKIRYEKSVFRNLTNFDERLTCWFKAAPMLNVTLCDTGGRRQTERARRGYILAAGDGEGKTKTSVLPRCYIKLLLSLTERSTRWTGSAVSFHMWTFEIWKSSI